jgi:hypothetical protein
MTHAGDAVGAGAVFTGALPCPPAHPRRSMCSPQVSGGAKEVARPANLGPAVYVLKVFMILLTNCTYMPTTHRYLGEVDVIHFRES